MKIWKSVRKFFGLEASLGDRFHLADAARDRRDWAAAAHHFGVLVAARPGHVGLLVQYGHALKDAGDTAGAARAYRSAAALAPDDTDALLHLAEMLRRVGQDAESVAVFGEILRRDTSHVRAVQALTEAGARDVLPDDFSSLPAYGLRLDHLAERQQALDRELSRWVSTAVHPRRAYDQFRRTFPVAPPPARMALKLHIAVDATDASPAMLRATLESLSDQTVDGWTASVAACPVILSHPVAGYVDPRISFKDEALHSPEVDYVLAVPAGIVLDSLALAWLGFVAERTAAAAVFADHDRVERDWLKGDVRFAPTLFGVFDADVLAATNDPPLCVLLRVALFDGPSGRDRNRRLVLAAAGTGPVVHLPRILSSILRLASPARSAPVCDAAAVGELGARRPASQDVDRPLTELQRADGAVITTSAPQPVVSETIAILIPTRDSPLMLERCVDTLRRTARHPHRLRFFIVDNRSETLAGRAVLARLADIDGVSIVSDDRPFNWSRINNRLLDLSDAPTFVFANDDTEMRTKEWDLLTEGFCRRPDVGAVGARLLYPDESYQHAGILLGVGDQHVAIHEGLGHAGNVGGPMDRWLQTRSTAAVTGAFLATPRSVMASVDGFDETLALAYNDIDYCLRVRAHGFAVLYAPALCLVHHESQTRGQNVSRDQVAWDQSELFALAKRWGPAVRWDPSYNPHWALGGQPFDGYREPALSEILCHVDRAANGNPWHINPPIG